MPALHRPVPNYDRTVLADLGHLPFDDCEIDPDLLPSIPSTPCYVEVEDSIFIHGIRHTVTRRVIVSSSYTTRKVQS